ncbi:MAG: methylenetetrahydrofolate reductase [Euryarchaeota archaeon]|nr:methylenetetrahydrofolate reductase [Euryarchaeota archaeon]
MVAPQFVRQPFTLTYELNPPRSTTANKLLAQAAAAAPYVDAFNLTDCPMSNLRMAPGPVADRIQRDLKVATIPHVTARDRNLLGIQSELLGFAFLGIRNVFALTGDPIKIGDHPNAKGVYELFANQLIELIQKLNGGKDAVGQAVTPAPQFSVGAAVTLTDGRPEGLEAFQRKVQAGTDFFQTQIVLDAKSLDANAHKYETTKPVIVGTTPLRNAKMLEAFRTIPGVDVTDRVVKRLAAAKDFAAEANRLVLELRDAVKGRYAGLHLMPITPDEDQVVALLRELRGKSAAVPVVARRAEDLP